MYISMLVVIDMSRKQRKRERYTSTVRIMIIIRLLDGTQKKGHKSAADRGKRKNGDRVGVLVNSRLKRS